VTTVFFFADAGGCSEFAGGDSGAFGTGNIGAATVWAAGNGAGALFKGFGCTGPATAACFSALSPTFPAAAGAGAAGAGAAASASVAGDGGIANTAGASGADASVSVRPDNR